MRHLLSHCDNCLFDYYILLKDLEKNHNLELLIFV